MIAVAHIMHVFADGMFMRCSILIIRGPLIQRISPQSTFVIVAEELQLLFVDWSS